MPLRTGIDIVEIDRFGQLLDKHGENLTEDFFTPPERSRAQTSDRPARWYAAYWAIREAAFKIGNGSLWNHYSVLPSGDRVTLTVSDDLYEASSCNIPEEAEWDTSLTRTEEKVVATAIASWSLSVT